MPCSDGKFVAESACAAAFGKSMYVWSVLSLFLQMDISNEIVIVENSGEKASDLIYYTTNMRCNPTIFMVLEFIQF